MGLFNRKNKGPAQTYSRDELFRKEKAKEPMTYGELEALNREKQKDLTNQILRVAGLFAVLFAVGLAVFVFLYPYSLFNLFATSKGGGDQFWDLWNHWSINVGKDYGAGWGDIPWIGTKSELEGGEPTGFVTMATVLAHGFQPGSTWKANFYCMGGWSIILVATVGFVAIIVYAAYIVAYNVKDLIIVIKHVIHRTGYVVKDVVDIGAASVAETGTKKKKAPKKPTKKETPEEIVRRTEEEAADEKVGGYTSEQLDALLRGESVGDVPASTTGGETKDLFSDVK